MNTPVGRVLRNHSQIKFAKRGRANIHKSNGGSAWNRMYPLEKKRKKKETPGKTNNHQMKRVVFLGNKQKRIE